jgi:hypothetical protein
LRERDKGMRELWELKSHRVRKLFTSSPMGFSHKIPYARTTRRKRQREETSLKWWSAEDRTSISNDGRQCWRMLQIIVRSEWWEREREWECILREAKKGNNPYWIPSEICSRCLQRTLLLRMLSTDEPHRKWARSRWRFPRRLFSFASGLWERQTEKESERE